MRSFIAKLVGILILVVWFSIFAVLITNAIVEANEFMPPEEFNHWIEELWGWIVFLVLFFAATGMLMGLVAWLLIMRFCKCPN